MSNDRISPSVKVDHVIIFAHVTELLVKEGAAAAFDYFRENVDAMQKFGGALQVPLKPVDPPAPPPPVGNGPLARFDAAPSDWAAWRFITDAERAALEAKYPERQVEIVNFVQFYAGGSAGGVGVNGYRDVGGGYYFWRLKDGTEQLAPDVDGAADAYINELCDAQQRPRPGHLR